MVNVENFNFLKVNCGFLLVIWVKWWSEFLIKFYLEIAHKKNMATVFLVLFNEASYYAFAVLVAGNMCSVRKNRKFASICYPTIFSTHGGLCFWNCYFWDCFWNWKSYKYQKTNVVYIFLEGIMNLILFFHFLF